VPPDATAPTSLDVERGTVPDTLDALSGPLFLALGKQMKTRNASASLPFSAQVYEHAANTCRARSAIRRAHPLDIAEVEKGIRRLDGCDVQFVPAPASSW
ncbi:hypothetical protein QUS51_22595, partial [Xanthomonas citri pv. citri]